MQRAYILTDSPWAASMQQCIHCSLGYEGRHRLVVIVSCEFTTFYRNGHLFSVVITGSATKSYFRGLNPKDGEPSNANL